MTRLIVILLAGALAWMSWWALGQVAYEKALSAWIDQRRAEGWAADYATLNTAGFPNRFDTRLTDLRLADPETGIAWTVPELQLLSLAYRPHQVIAVVPRPHRFSTPVETLEIAHDDARASLFLGAAASLPLERARLVVEGLELASSAGWQSSLAEGRFAAERIPATETAYRLGAEIDGLTPAEPLRDLLDPAGFLPATIERLHFDAEVAFDAPWDRRAVEDRRPQPGRIDLAEFSARWGTVTFRAAGEVEIDEAGRPEGRIVVRAEEWRKLLDMAVASGLLPEEARGPVASALELLGGGSGKIDAPLTFDAGLVRLGPVPLGPAPRLVIR